MTEETKEYITTKEQCMGNIKGVCSGCGGEITPMETIDNSGNPTFWPGCASCEVFDYGVDSHIFNIAKQMVEDGHVHYSRDILATPDGKSDGYKQYWLSSQIRGTTGLVRKILALHNKLKSK